MNPAVTVKENHAFHRIYRKGASVVTPCFVMYCQKNRQGKSRLGVTVSTKLGHAVVRNRIRRRLRELYRLYLPQTQTGYDIILVGRSRAAKVPWNVMEQEYDKALKKLQLELPS